MTVVRKRETGCICVSYEHSCLPQKPSQKPWGYFSGSNSNSTLTSLPLSPHGGLLCSVWVNGSSSYHLNPEVRYCVCWGGGREAEVGHSTLNFILKTVKRWKECEAEEEKNMQYIKLAQMCCNTLKWQMPEFCRSRLKVTCCCRWQHFVVYVYHRTQRQYPELNLNWCL